MPKLGHKGANMQEYVNRLMRCGMPPHDALRMCKAMIKDFGFKALEELTASMEAEAYVDRVQSESCR